MGFFISRWKALSPSDADDPTTNVGRCRTAGFKLHACVQQVRDQPAIRARHIAFSPAATIIVEIIRWFAHKFQRIPHAYVFCTSVLFHAGNANCQGFSKVVGLGSRLQEFDAIGHLNAAAAGKDFEWAIILGHTPRQHDGAKSLRLPGRNARFQDVLDASCSPGPTKARLMLDRDELSLNGSLCDRGERHSLQAQCEHAASERGPQSVRTIVPPGRAPDRPGRRSSRSVAGTSGFPGASRCRLCGASTRERGGVPIATSRRLKRAL